MQKTLFGVMVLSVFTGIVLQIFPKESRMMPYVRFLLSLVLLVMLLSPLITMLKDWRIADLTALMPVGYSAADYDGFWEMSVMDAAAERAEMSLNAFLCAEFGLETQDLCVALTTETVYGDKETTVTVTAVTVTLHRRVHRIAADKIAALAEKTMLCPCTVVFSEEEHA